TETAEITHKIASERLTENGNREAVETIRFESSRNGQNENGKLSEVSTSAPESLVSPWRDVYSTYVLPDVPFPSEEFYNLSNTRILQEQISKVIDKEGPISRKLLTRRVILAWGMNRSGAKIERYMDNLLLSIGTKKTTWGGIDFFW